jgi:hypothetical protein
MIIKLLPIAVTVALAATTTLGGMQRGKPQQPPPPPSTYSATLGPSIYDNPTSTGNPEDYPDGSRDGLKSAGHLSLASTDLIGSITGPNNNDNFIGTIGGPINGLVITGVDELPDWFDSGDPCQEDKVDQLRALGLVGSPLSGSLTWSFGELGGSLKGNPRIDWHLDGVMDSAGAPWSLEGHSGSSRPIFFPLFESGSTEGNFTVTVEGSVIDFVGPTMTVRKCRADFTMTLTKVSP